MEELNKVPELTRTQEKTIENINNIVNDHLTEMDFSGTLRDLQGNPVPKPGGGYWNHIQEMKDAYTGLTRSKKSLINSLKNPNLSPSTRKALQKFLDIAEANIRRIDDLFRPYGGIK